MIDDHYAEPPETLTFRIAGEEVEYRRVRRGFIGPSIWIVLGLSLAVALLFAVGTLMNKG